MARLAPQASAAAVWARLQADELREFLAHDERIGLAVTPLEVRHHTFERMFLDARAAALARIVECDRFLAGPVQDQLLDAVIEHFPRLLDVETKVLRQRLQHRVIEMVAAVPATDGAAGKRQVWMRHDAFRVEELDE